MSDQPRITVWDGVVPHLDAYRAACLAQPFASLTFGPKTFHGIATPPDMSLLDWLADRGIVEEAMTTFLRKSPAGQREPHDVHDDGEMGAWTAILYLTAQPPLDDGTTFWRHRATGAYLADATVPTWAGTRREAWDPWRTVAALPNRLVWFPARCFHSRAIFENYGEGDDARLIQVVFGGPPAASADATD